MHSQREALEMMAEITKGIFSVLEKMAQNEIEKDPVKFIRKESLMMKKDGISPLRRHY